jgi:hypothetical protein
MFVILRGALVQRAQVMVPEVAGRSTKGTATDPHLKT